MPSSQCDVGRALMPHTFEVLWVLALETTDKPDALARDVYEHAFERGRPEYQKWTPRKVASVLGQLQRRGLVESSRTTDKALPGIPTRRWHITEKGWTVLNP